jgi:hypothetical protein
METKMALNYQGKSQKRSAVEKYVQTGVRAEDMIKERLISIQALTCVMAFT